jgi:hypothetical protein
MPKWCSDCEAYHSDDFNFTEGGMNSFFQWIADFFRGMKPWVTVMPWEKAIRIRFGKYVREFEAGIHFRIPHLDEYVIVNTRLRVATTGMQTISTKDGKTVSASCSIGFLMDNPLESYRKVAFPEPTVAAYAGTLLSKYISERNLAQISIPEICSKLLKELGTFGGIKFEFVAVTDFVVVRTYRLLQETGARGVYGGDGPGGHGIRTF